MATCLVVDDVTVSLFTARTFLEEMGIDVKQASDGEAALSVLEEEKIDVMLLDWHLKKKSGLELLEVIRNKYGNSMKVIVFSGVEDSKRADDAIIAGADGYMTKPTTKEKIEAELKNVGIL